MAEGEPLALPIPREQVLAGLAFISPEKWEEEGGDPYLDTHRRWGSDREAFTISKTFKTVIDGIEFKFTRDFTQFVSTRSMYAEENPPSEYNYYLSAHQGEVDLPLGSTTGQLNIYSRFFREIERNIQEYREEKAAEQSNMLAQEN